MRALNALCSIAVEVVFVLFFSLAVLAPFHAATTRHLTLIQTIDSSHAIIAGDVSGLSAGTVVPLYRFNHDWKVPIGNAVVQSVANDEAVISVQPEGMSWSLGKSGKLLADGGTPYVTLGASAGIQPGEYLTVFRDRVDVGQVQVIKVEAQRSSVTPIAVVGQVDGLTVSNFSFATQAVIFDDVRLAFIEYVVIGGFLVGYLLVYLWARRSPYLLLGECIRRVPLPQTALFWIVNILAGVPFVWFMAKMPLYLCAYLIDYAAQYFFQNSLYLFPLANSLLPYMYGLLAILYYGYLVWMRRSPVLAFWQFISYPSTELGTSRGHSAIQEVSFTRGFVLWALHLVIVYFFATTLIGFFVGDMNAALSIGFPAPSREAFFEQLKDLIWALTVVGVLLGYAYSVVSILWGKYIRNLDFTITGWLTNAFCYPLLGVVIWQMIPSFTGPDPIITGGPLETLMLVLGFLLNLLYMLSIWNLGILFDLMADKGVRKSGFYSVIRHPNYTLEVSMFFVTELIGLSAGVQWLAICMYFFLYWIRSEREDNFMGWSNPDYEEYRAQTRWKFIPGFY